jgi:hypothetical protein
MDINTGTSLMVMENLWDSGKRVNILILEVNSK